MQQMKYIIHSPNKFRSPGLAFLISTFQIVATLMLELTFIFYIQEIRGIIDITANFIAIQVVTQMDDFLGSLMHV